MKKDEFENILNNLFDSSELLLINNKIYYNPVHIDYYINYNIGNYQFCIDYLTKNRNLLKNINQPYDNRKKLGRNNLCHCGSGNKFKKCCITK